MNFQLSSWAIRRPIPTIVLFLCLTLAGVVSFLNLPINANPRVDFPIVSVTVVQAGAAPAELETLVTRRVEGAISGMSGIRHITSTVADGASVTTVEFQLEVNPDRATNDVRDAVSQIRSDLPQTIEEPIVSRLDVEGGAILYYAVKSSARGPVDLSWFVDDTVSREILSVAGVQRVQRLGGVDHEVRVELRPDRLTALGITADQVNAQLAQVNVDVPGGRGGFAGREHAIRTLGSAATVADLASTPLALPGGRWATLSDLAHVTDGSSEVRSIARLNGEPVVGFAVFRAKGSSDTVVAEGVEAAIADLQAQYRDMQIHEIVSTVDYTLSSYEAAMHTLLEGALLTVIVVFFFLRDWRATLIAAVALPLSILPTFAAMAVFDFTLNSITLLALTLVIGILVDDAIVEIENIDRHLHMGKRPFQAAIDAADAIGFAVVAITATIVAVFLPVSFIGGFVGQYFEQFGITVAVAVLASLLVARLVTPLMAAYIMKPKTAPHVAPKHSGLKARYLGGLTWALAHRGVTMAIGAAFLVGSVMLIPLLPSGFLPTGDRSLSQLNVSMPPGTPLAETDAVVQRIATDLRRHPGVLSVFASAGSDDAAGAGDVGNGSLVIRLKPPKERDLSQKEFEQAVRPALSRIDDIRFSFQGESAARDISIILVGSDPAGLAEGARDLEAEMRGVGGIANVQVNEPLPRPELLIRPRLDEAARSGVSPVTIGTVARIATVGDIDANSAKFNLGDRQVPIRVSLPIDERGDLETLRSLRVPTDAGETVPLSAVADVRFGDGSARIERFDRLRRVSVDADLAGAALGTALADIAALPAMQNLPEGLRQVEYGDAEYMTEMFEKFGLAMAFGILMVFGVLVLLFKDFFQPITILTALPLSIGGAIGGLLLFGAALDLPAVIGILMLMGIVTKNSILLVEFAIEKRREGLSRHDALMQSGSDRARPIIMTTIAMIAGMIPAVLSTGADAGFRAPMAVAVIGGLVTSTLLSLIFVPVVFTYMDDLRGWAGRKLGRATSVTGADREAADRSLLERRV